MPQPSQLFKRAPYWLATKSEKTLNVPDPVRSWLHESGSLTQRLRLQAGNFQVRVLTQRWQKPFRDEATLLNLAPYRFALIREVLLQDADQTMVLARSIIPPETARRAHQLAKLGNRPLGEVLFACPHLQRLELEITRVRPTFWQPAFQSQTSIWGRRSIYQMANGSLLVSEFFLPILF